jgi:U3 small nucleolar RNA-associated protein 4
MLSADGKILIVATVSAVKVFSVRRRKSDERGTLRITKLDVPAAFSKDGARAVSISPDSRWLCVVRPDSAIYLARVMPASSPQDKPQILPQLVKLDRATRHTRHEKASHGSLGDYERTVRCVVFSENSRILATGDLSGCIDTWLLKDVKDSSAVASNKRNGAADSDDESSDDEDERPVIDGERWQYANADSPIPRLKSGVLLLSFRPQSPAEAKLLTNGADQSSQISLRGESRLMALTSEHQLVEFDTLEGKLSDWSRRNPKAYLPEQFKGVKDRAMGCLWDLSESRDRLWLYGTSWLWMFDLNQDFPSSEEMKEAADGHEGDSSTQLVKTSSAHKRKREQMEEEEKRGKANSGAGDRMSLAQSDVHLGSKYRKIEGHDDSKGEWVSLDKERPQAAGDEEAFEYDENSAAVHDTALARLRRGKLEEDGISTPRKRVSLGPRDNLLSLNGSNDTPSRKPNDHDMPDTPQTRLVQPNGTQPARRWWYTYKYRDLLGIVPLSPPSAEDGVEDDTAGNTLEVAIVERPMWDVELPGRYVRDYA